MTEDIIDNVSGPDDIETLLTCSLVSKTWLRRSRQRMFRRVFIPDEAELGAFTDLCAAPLASIPDYVQELVLGRNARGTVMKLEHDQLATLLTLLPGISDLTLINILWHTNEAYPALAGRLARMSYQPRHLSMLKLLGVTGRASTLTTAGLASLMHLFDAVESLYFLWDTEVKLLADGGSVGTTAKFRAFPTIYDLVLPNTPMSTRVLEWMDDMGLCGSLLSLSVYISDNAMLKALGKVLRSSGQSLRALSIYLFGWKQLTRLSGEQYTSSSHDLRLITFRTFRSGRRGQDHARLQLRLPQSLQLLGCTAGRQQARARHRRRMAMGRRDGAGLVYSAREDAYAAGHRGSPVEAHRRHDRPARRPPLEPAPACDPPLPAAR